MKASYGIATAFYELIVVQETERSYKLLTICVDSVALLGLLTIELQTLTRDLMKHKLPHHLKQLAMFHQIPPMYLVMTFKSK